MIVYGFRKDCIFELFIYVNSQNKLQNLAGQRSDVLENLTPNFRKRVDALRDIQVSDISFTFSQAMRAISFNGVLFCFALLI